MGVKADASKIRKVLREAGYRWLIRSKKRLYTKEEKAVRLRFATAALRLTLAELRRKMSMSMDGVVIGVPPQDPIDRANHCRVGDAKVWRKPSEGGCPQLDGFDCYGHQVPLKRAIAFWGGVSESGYRTVLFHSTKKLAADTWAESVEKGDLRKARAQPRSEEGPVDDSL